MVAVAREKSLQTVTNFFIVSLATADFLVALCVMPFAVYYEVNRSSWQLGTMMCVIYITTDVMMSTASILNLFSICIDRFMAITKPIYYSRHGRSTRRGVITICAVWLTAALIATPAILVNKIDPAAEQCIFTNAYYIIGSSLGSFWLPCALMTAMYAVVLKQLHDREVSKRREREQRRRPRPFAVIGHESLFRHVHLARDMGQRLGQSAEQTDIAGDSPLLSQLPKIRLEKGNTSSTSSCLSSELDEELDSWEPTAASPSATVRSPLMADAAGQHDQTHLLQPQPSKQSIASAPLLRHSAKSHSHTPDAPARHHRHHRHHQHGTGGSGSPNSTAPPPPQLHVADAPAHAHPPTPDTACQKSAGPPEAQQLIAVRTSADRIDVLLSGPTLDQTESPSAADDPRTSQGGCDAAAATSCGQRQALRAHESLPLRVLAKVQQPCTSGVAAQLGPDAHCEPTTRRRHTVTAGDHLRVGGNLPPLFGLRDAQLLAACGDDALSIDHHSKARSSFGDRGAPSHLPYIDLNRSPRRAPSQQLSRGGSLRARSAPVLRLATLEDFGEVDDVPDDELEEEEDVERMFYSPLPSPEVGRAADNSCAPQPQPRHNLCSTAAVRMHVNEQRFAWRPANSCNCDARSRSHASTSTTATGSCACPSPALLHTGTPSGDRPPPAAGSGPRRGSAVQFGAAAATTIAATAVLVTAPTPPLHSRSTSADDDDCSRSTSALQVSPRKPRAVRSISDIGVSAQPATRQKAHPVGGANNNDYVIIKRADKANGSRVSAQLAPSQVDGEAALVPAVGVKARVGHKRRPLRTSLQKMHTAIVERLRSGVHLTTVKERIIPTRRQRKKEQRQIRRERKATHTLAVVLAVFLCCWIPFFTCHTAEAICLASSGGNGTSPTPSPASPTSPASPVDEEPPGCVPFTAFFITTWVGYMNSFMNPIIYTIFNPDYRKAFKRVLHI